MLVCGVVVQDKVQWSGLRGLLVEHLQKPQPFLMAMSWLTGPDQLAREDIEGGE
jgi:hypothetical protein